MKTPAITIVGFGSQAKAWALNFKDSNAKINIALKSSSKNHQLAQSLGFATIDLESEDLKKSDTLILLIPDDQHFEFFKTYHQNISPETLIIYAHGFSLAKYKLDQIYSSFRHALLAPKAIASEVRFQFETKGKIGAAFYAPDSETKNQLENIAKLVGFNALYNSNYDEETKADLFSEQSLLCSILPYVSLEAFKVLRKNGISKEVAFMECFLELGSISKAIVSLGPEAFFNMISPNALIGAYKGKNLLVDDSFKKKLESLFEDINSEKFYTEAEIDVETLRKKMMKEWDAEELTHVYKELKTDLIN